MTVFVTGGCHTGSYGVQTHLSFARQWVAHLETAAHESVSLHCLSMVKLAHIDSLLTQHEADLQTADLIVLQLGHYELSWRQPFFTLFQSGKAPANLPSVYVDSTVPRPQQATEKLHKAATSSRPGHWQDGVKTGVLQAYQLMYTDIPYLRTVRRQLLNTFDKLADFRTKIIVLTPFPTLNRLDHWLRAQCHQFIVDCAVQRSFTVADTFDAIPRHPAFFQADGVHLNSLGHLVLALFLSELPCVMDLHREPPYAEIS